MFSRDFFAFCTSLKPIELKAMGALSAGRQTAVGEVLYRAGDEPDALYIVNRGVLEVVANDSPNTEQSVRLSRGDVFGDLEVLTRVPRKHCVRTREEASLRCIQQQALPELLEKVPSFFRFLCNHLAHRLIELPAGAVPEPASALELAGSFSNFDVVTIYQTIMNSAQTGELSILRDDGSARAVFSFDEGRPRGGRFEHLRGEEAYWQLFQTQLQGSFSFSSGPAPTLHVLEPGWVERSADELLITALQARDELDVLRAALPDDTAVLKPRRPHLDVCHPSEGVSGALLGQIWERSCARTTTLGELYPRFMVSELKIYLAVDELVKTGHIELSTVQLPQKVA